MLKLMRVIGETEEGKTVVGVLLYGRIYHKKTTYYIKNNDGEVIPCIKCIEDNPKF